MRYSKKWGCKVPCKSPMKRNSKGACSKSGRKNRPRCPKGYKRSKSGSCVTKYKLLTYKSR
jgi:hypothetical protein